MIKLEPHEICPHGESCGHVADYLEYGFTGCLGTNPDRDRVFVCECSTIDQKSVESVHSSKGNP
jgi:hypothetical protein